MFLTILTEEFLFYSVNEKICVSGSLFLFLHLFIYLFLTGCIYPAIALMLEM